MSEFSDKAIGNVKSIVGEVLGDGKLVEEGERQEQDGDSGRSGEDRYHKSPDSLNELT